MDFERATSNQCTLDFFDITLGRSTRSPQKRDSITGSNSEQNITISHSPPKRESSLNNSNQSNSNSSNTYPVTNTPSTISIVDNKAIPSAVSSMESNTVIATTILAHLKRKEEQKEDSELIEDSNPYDIVGSQSSQPAAIEINNSAPIGKQDSNNLNKSIRDDANSIVLDEETISNL